MRILTLFFYLALCACSSSDSDETQALANQEAPLELFAADPLDLDFTFPIGDLLDDAESLAGIDVDSNGVVSFLFSDGAIAQVTLDGELIGSQSLSLSASAVGLAIGTDDELLVADNQGSVWSFAQNSGDLSVAASAITGLAGVTATTDTLFTLGNGQNGLLLAKVAADGTSSAIESNPELALYEGLSMDFLSDRLFVLTTDPSDQAVVLELDADANFLAAWQIEGNPVAIAVTDVNLRGPTLLTVNVSDEVTVRQYEPPALPGDVDTDLLEVLSTVELGEEGLPQPSGVSVYDNRLYFISDFGVVASSNLEGEDFEILFQIPDATQGTFESIDVDEIGRIHVLASDESETEVTVFDTSGVVLEERDLLEDGTIVEGYQISGETAYWTNHAPGVPKVLYRMADNTVSTIPLSADYDAFAITGLAVASEYFYLVTDQRETEAGVLSGLILQCDLATGEEVSRYAVADETGAGVISPSGIAVAQNAGVLYVTSDTDVGTVIGYDID